MKTEQALAVLAELEAAHGPDVLATILGAAFRRDTLAERAEAIEEDGEEEHPIGDWLFESETERMFWLSGFERNDAFHVAYWGDENPESV